MSSPKIHKAKVKVNGCHYPMTFVRKYTYITFKYIASLNTSSFSVWQACHVALNASAEGHLTTDELEKAIRSHYPEKKFQSVSTVQSPKSSDRHLVIRLSQSTLIQKLSQSGDFAQVFPDGKTPGRWFLTGQTNGSEKSGANDFSPDVFERHYTRITFEYLTLLKPAEISVRKACHAVLNASKEGCLTTEELVVAMCFHYPEKVFQRSTLSYTLSHSKDFAQVFPGGKTPGRWFLTDEAEGAESANAIARAPEHAESPGTFSRDDSDHGRDTNPDSPLIPEAPFVTNPDSQLDAGPGCNMSSVQSWGYTGDEFSCMIDGLHGLNVVSQELVERQVPLPTTGSSPIIPAAQARTGSLPFEFPDPHGPGVTHRSGLEPNTPERPDIVRPTMKGFRMVSTVPEDFMGEAVRLKPTGCGVMIADELLHLAYHTMACPSCFKACATDNRSLYHSLVAKDDIPFDVPRSPIASSGKPEAGTEIPTAGVQLHDSLGLLLMDVDI
ncbi:hypothetical protein FRC00_009423 [Tulasnella sp. 408]|nr:hypothetical protein FRC00_009423 [Tulasnella sp. 408]